MQSIVSGGFRLASLSLRMVLMLFMARFLPFKDIGVFSLVVGTAALLPGAAGLGLSYFVNRDVVGGSAKHAHDLARDRLLVTFGCGVASAVGVFALIKLGKLDLAVDIRVFGAIIVLEMIGFDLQFLLIARHRAALSNFLLFLRAAAWIPLFMVLAFLNPALRSVDVLLQSWLLGEFASFVAAIFFLRHAIDRSLVTRSFDIDWLGRQFPRVMPVWLSDLSLALGQNVDRFVISSLIGVEEAGIYFFFFSIGSAAFQIVQSAAIQPAMPHMRELFKNGGGTRLGQFVSQSLKKVALYATGVVCCAGVGSVVLVIFLRRAELNDEIILVAPVMLGFLAKSVNEYLGIIDYVTERDMQYIIINVLTLIMATVFMIPLTMMLGLLGTASSFLLTMGAFAVLRWRIWGRGDQNVN